MNPNKRLDQIEPVMADVLQKVDRLIEGHGQLVEMVVSTKAELKAAGESTARAVANLTVTTQKQFEELKASHEKLAATQEELKAGQELILQILREKLP
ncbi:hypothetical protein [Spirosoma foliorum]|uniref:Uncharacterized protein n=1 Tax=Spirosoma foliorum TaxID=2710596 RepID=A0A7G5H4V3_9BACT|nr:hypothetical protein [Spirosoma foliorum]QMW06145.1 hypothetical protein H3H32_15255 [Spirosoma foliorum]